MGHCKVTIIPSLCDIRVGCRGLLKHNRYNFPMSASYRRLSERIVRDPNICHGKPVIRGLRYPVQTILELLASGMSIDEILQDYPDLERDDILACLEYAARLTQLKTVEAM